MSQELSGSPELSRRAVLGTGAAAGVAGIAAGALGVAAMTSSGAAGSSAAGSSPAGSSPAGEAAASAPIVVHVRDARTGDVEIFAGDAVVRVRDSVITSRIRSAL